MALAFGASRHFAEGDRAASPETERVTDAALGVLGVERPHRIGDASEGPGATRAGGSTTDPSAVVVASGAAAATDVVGGDSPENKTAPSKKAGAKKASGKKASAKKGSAKKGGKKKSAGKKTKKISKAAAAALAARPRVAIEDVVIDSEPLNRSAEQEEWDESWEEDGFEPPVMIPTPVQGKLISRKTRAGEPGALIGLITFFPIGEVAGGALLPVITPLFTDERGRFAGEIPVPEIAPIAHPVLAISANARSRVVMTATAVPSLRPGEENQLGVFWSDERMIALRCYAGGLPGDQVVVTGALDPQRWHPAVQGELLPWFPTAKIAGASDLEPTDDLPAGFARVLLPWDGRLIPHVSLLANAYLSQTRLPVERPTTKSGEPATEAGLPAPFENLTFDFGRAPTAGVVVDGSGRGVETAAITATAPGFARTFITDAVGRFLLEQPPEDPLTMQVEHPDFVTVRREGVPTGDTSVRIVLPQRKPRLVIRAFDEQTGTLLPALTLRVEGGGESAAVEVNSPTGEHVFEWDRPISRLAIERAGYRSVTVPDPMAIQEAQGVIEVQLPKARDLTFRPRDFTSARDSSRWFPDPNDGPGVYTAWANQWIEWEVPFGDVSSGVEGGFFDVIVGATNKGIVDNNYRFAVDVFVDEEKRGTLSILADSLHTQTARMSLGQLQGARRIRLSWHNDKHIRGQLDANIRLATLQFIERSVE
jgi:hypothetical protein